MDNPLTNTQLEMVVLLANGHNMAEIAALVHRSESSVKKTIAVAKDRAGAKSLAHLVSIVIASGVLEWSDGDGERQTPWK